MWYIKQWLCWWYQTLYVHDIFTLYGITHNVMTTNHCVPSKPLCLVLHSEYFWYYKKCTNFITRSECKSSQPLYIWHHMHYKWHHIHSLWHHATLFMTSSPLYLTSLPLYVTLLPLYLCNHTHCINDITATLYMISHMVYLWQPTPNIYDIISTMYDNTTLCVVDTALGICVTSFALQMISNPLYHTKTTIFMMSHPFRAWHHNHSIRHRTHCIFVITSSPLISYPLLYDIIPTINVTSYALYITSYQLLTSSHFCTYDIRASIYETTSNM